jgi:hypothetical protein
MLCDLFDRWERVWHEGQYDLVAQCVQPNYIRHDEAGDRTVTREACAAEIAKTRSERPDIRIIAYDHTFEGDRAWFRFEFKWTDSLILRLARSARGQECRFTRIEAGKLAETWLMLQPLGSAWTDAVAQAARLQLADSGAPVATTTWSGTVHAVETALRRVPPQR